MNEGELLDPFLGSGSPSAPPFAMRFPDGIHPVEVAIVRKRNDERVALARVLFSHDAPVK